MSESSESEVNLKDFGDYYVEFNMTIEKISEKIEELKEVKEHKEAKEIKEIREIRETFQESPSPTANERKRSYNYQKLLKEYEIAALDGINRR